MQADEFKILDNRDGFPWEVVVPPEEPDPRDLVFVRRTRGWGGRVAVVRRTPRPAGPLDDAELLRILEDSRESAVVLPNDLDAHRDNARECFQGMRAYHQSEIAHTGHALDLLKGILVSTLALYGGLIGLAASNEMASPGLDGTGVVFLAAVWAVLWSTTENTFRKIDADHARYEEFRSELNKERMLLGVHATWGLRHRSSRPGSGYDHTKRLVGTAALSVAILALIGCCALLLID
jgi:hypothetical protein